ncbi:MAG: amino acid adenylation domain-containing protein [Candidatus Magnetomorum sp.]|nr:amino acid adenylation domain-containing protein [Candidatus Magnetomorum sp.]
MKTKNELMQLALKGDTDAIRELRRVGILKSVHETDTKKWVISPVSHAQRRLWIISQTDDASIAYNIPEVFMVDGQLDVDIFERAFAELVQRHESLRTTFEFDDINGELYQKIHNTINFKINFKDLTGEAHPQESARESIRNIITRPYDLKSGPLFRVTILKIAKTLHILGFSLHHIISDTWSMNILSSEFCAMYEAFQRGDANPFPPLRIQYKDYAAWQNSFLKSEDIIAHQRYWCDIFSGEIPILNLPMDFSRPRMRTFKGRTIRFTLSDDQTKKIRDLSQENSTTIFITLLTALNLLIYRYTGQEDIIIGSPVAGRNHADLENQLGFYVNTLPLRNQIKGERSFNELLNHVKKVVADAFDHQMYPFDKLVEKLDIQGDPGRSPLFDIMIVMESEDEREMTAGSLRFTPFEHEYHISKFDMIFFFVEDKNAIKLNIEYNMDLFLEARVRRMGEHFKCLITGILDAPDVPAGQLNMLTENELNTVLYTFNNTRRDYPEDRCIHQLFEEQVKKTPDSVAVIFEDKQLTYKELNAKSNQLAHYLKSSGVGPEILVGICVERSIEMIVGILGILKAGGAYVPLDPEYPADRLTFMMNDANVKVLLLQKKITDTFPFHNKQIVRIDADKSIIEEKSVENPDSDVRPSNLAYILYTSGSTGIPKGVAIEHRSPVALVSWAKRIYSEKELAGTLVSTSICFDLSVYEMFTPLSSGGTIIIAQNALELPDLISANSVTLINTVPSAIQELVKLNAIPDSVTTVNLAGEPLPSILVDKIYDTKTVQKVYDLYGPSEDTTYSTFILRKKGGINTIGKPIDNTKTYILDKYLNPLPVGVPGQLHISGHGLARGYHNRSELTKDKFIPNPFDDVPDSRLYKTGDLATWLPDGNIEFLGRIDNQVKIRGYRIELGEIRSRLTAHPEIEDALIMVKETQQNSRELVAYIITSSVISNGKLRSFLGRSIPQFMIPSYFVLLEKFPLTLSGKIDQKALPGPHEVQHSADDTEYVQPRNETETKLVAVWQNLLGKKRIGIHDNYFDLGGDSIKAIQIASRLAQEGMKLEISTLLLNPTIAELSDKVVNTALIINQELVTGNVLLTAVQSWFFENHKKQPNHFNQSVMLYSKERLNENSLRAVLKKIQEHHDALRMMYQFDGENIIQLNADLDYPLGFEIINMINTADPDGEIEAYANKVQAEINLNTGPLMKVVLFHLNDSDHLMIVIHHLVIDGVSWRILLEDMITGYKQHVSGEQIKFPPKTVSFKLWAKQVQDYSNSEKLLREKTYWKTLESVRTTPLPLDYKGGDGDSILKDTRTLNFYLPQEKVEVLLTKVNHIYNTEINDILLTALARTMHQWHGNKKTMITLEGHGREKIDDTDIKRTVGWFTSMYPLALELPDSEDLGYQIKYIKEMLRKVPDKGMGYGILKYVTSHENKKDMLFGSMPGICFNYLGQFDEDAAGVFQVSERSCGNDISPNAEFIYTININSMIIHHQLQVSFSYSEKKYKFETINTIGTDFINNLIAVINHCTNVEDSEITPHDIDYDGLDIDGLDTLLNNL